MMYVYFAFKIFYDLLLLINVNYPEFCTNVFLHLQLPIGKYTSDVLM